MPVKPIVAASVAALLAGCASMMMEEEQQTASASAPASEGAPPGLSVSDQPASSSIVVGRASMPEDGFVVIHATDANGDIVVPESVGSAPVSAGVNRSVAVPLDEPAESGETYVAMLHYDDNDNGVYEFGPGSTEVDLPVTVDGGPVVAAINVN